MSDHHHDDTMPIVIGSAVPDGQRIGRYSLLRRLGQGGMAEVFLARQEGPSDFSKTVVVKRMLSHLVENKRYVDMFLREARVAARLNHPNVVQLFELGQDQGTYFLAMEFIDGITLHRLAKRCWRRRKALPTEVIVRAVADAAVGLHHAHTLLDESGQPAGLIHRDISPDNLMLTRDGVTKVLDFGIAKSLEQRSGVTKTGELKGKIPYMSPEQIQGHTLDGRSDLFSLGVTFYWLLCGKRPFDALTEVMTLKRVLDEEPQPPSTVNKKVPASLDRVVMRLLEKDPEKRYRSGQHLHDRLIAMLGSEGSARGPAAQLVQEMIGLRDPDEDDPSSLGSYKAPASEPISTTFAATAITTTDAGEQKKRGALVGVAAAASVGFVGAVGLLVLTPWADEVGDLVDPPPAATDAGQARETTSADAGIAEQPTAAIVDAGAAPRRPAPLAESARTVTLKGPAHLVWKNGKTPQRGPGQVKVPTKVRSIPVLDVRRQSLHEVPIVDDVADFGALPTGKLRVNAVPFASVSLGSEPVGQTPPPPLLTLPIGKYKVKLVWEKVIREVTVDVKKGEEAIVRERMN